MSCHSWTYQELSSSEVEKMRDLIRVELEKDYRLVPNGKNMEKHIDETWKKFHDVYKNTTFNKKDIADEIKNNSHKLHQWLNEVDTCSLEKLTEIYTGAIILGCSYIVRDGKFYKQIGYDEPVRIYGYPDEAFTDAEEFISWVKKTECEKGHMISRMYLSDNSFNDGCDDVMEDKIREYWKNHDNNVYIEFG